MQKNSITNKITPCCGLPFSVIYWWVSNLTLNSESDRQFIISKISQKGTMTIEAWKVLVNSGTLEADASLTKAEFLAWFDCGRQPSCEQLKLIIEGFKVGNWTPETELPQNIGLIDVVVNGQNFKGNVYTKEQVNNLLTTSFGGDLVISDNPQPTSAKWYFAKESGTYPNAGGLVVDLTNKLVILSYDGTIWSKSEVAIPQASNNIRIYEDLPNGTILNAKEQVIYNNVYYIVLQQAVVGTDLPEISTKFYKINKVDSVLNLTSSNAIENKVLAKIVKDAFQKPDPFYNHIIGQTYQDSGTNGNYIGYGFGSGIIYASTGLVFPAGAYTIFIKYRVISKGNLSALRFFDETNQIKTIPATSIIEGQYYEDVVSFTKASSASSGIWAQIRTQYQANVSMNANFEIVAFKVFSGNLSTEDISVYSKVKYAEKADSVEKLGSNYTNTKKPTANKITNVYPTGIASWNFNTSGTVTGFYANVENGILKAGGKALNFTGVTGNSRIWFGFDIQPTYYATEPKSVYIILKGRAKTQNVRNLTFHKSLTGSTIYTILQDITDNTWTDFQTVIQLDYTQGTNDNTRYVHTDYVVYANNVDVIIDWEFSVFGIIEKTAETSLLSENDLVDIMLGKYDVIKKAKLPSDIVYAQTLESFKNNFKLPLGPEKLKSDFDITMIGGYGQSLAVGAGASSSSTNFENTLSFAKGNSLYDVPFTTTADKNAFYGTQFQNLNGRNVSYPPTTAAVVAMLQLIKSENLVNLTNFGLEFLPMTGGVSGASISTMKKGTTPYANYLEVIAKAKEFANVQGKTFGVSIINWIQGEADRQWSQATYYAALKQLFIDFNTDIKAITGQTKDVIFITYQTSAWSGVWFPSGNTSQQSGDTEFSNPLGVQRAQEQLASEEPNVYMCGAMYQFAYSDFFHPSDRANVGLQMGVAAKRVLNDGVDFPTFKPVSHSVIGNFIHLKFSAPKLPIRFDVSGDAFHNPRGKQTNFGFKVLNSSGTDIISAEPYIVRGDTVVIHCSASPVGCTIKYAENGHYGGGNLCDSQGVIISNKNQNYVIDNFAISFDNYII